MTNQPPTLFELAGGETAVRAVIDEFVHRVSADLMIGFFFRNTDLQQLRQREFEFTARFLGATDTPYSGRPLREAHTAHKIMGGQFDRRRQILSEVLVDRGIDPAVQEAWLAHVDQMRAQITGATREG